MVMVAIVIACLSSIHVRTLSLVLSPPSQILSLAVRIAQGSGIHHVNRISPGLLRVVRTASDDSCGGGLGPRLHISMVVPHRQRGVMWTFCAGFLVFLVGWWLSCCTMMGGGVSFHL